jgi:hypothetical protein
MRPTPKGSSYIEDGYNIILTDAPKDLGGRLLRNCARTTPELPKIYQSRFLKYLLFTRTYRVAE